MGSSDTTAYSCTSLSCRRRFMIWASSRKASGDMVPGFSVFTATFVVPFQVPGASGKHGKESLRGMARGARRIEGTPLRSPPLTHVEMEMDGRGKLCQIRMVLPQQRGETCVGWKECPRSEKPNPEGPIPLLPPISNFLAEEQSFSSTCLSFSFVLFC